MISIPMTTGRGQNDRMHWAERSRKVREERELVTWYLTVAQFATDIPCIVTLTRVAPSSGLDDDNLAGSLKSVRDAVAAWIGVDDKRRDVVRYEYAQRRGPWAVCIEARPM